MSLAAIIAHTMYWIEKNNIHPQKYYETKDDKNKKKRLQELIEIKKRIDERTRIHTASKD